MNESDRQQGKVLTAYERRTLEAVCDTFLPPMEPTGGDNPTLFALSARSIGVPQAVKEVLGELEPVKLLQMRVLLRALDQPALMRALCGVSRSFSALGQKERERVLKALGVSPIPHLRSGFQGLKRLSSLLFYSLTDEKGANPTWRVVGYEPVRNLPAREAPLKLTHMTKPAVFECDVCVIGSGAGGGVIAGELAAVGKCVLVLEAGGGYQAPDYDQRELTGFRRLYLDQGLTANRDLSVSILAGATLGGGTAVNWQTSLPLPGEVREEWARLSGCDRFASPEFTRSMDAVMTRLCVSTDESAINPNNDALRRGCEALGYSWQTIARNADACDPAQCGSCVFGCRHGGKQSTALTYLADAQALGNTTIVPDCEAERVVVQNGRVAAVMARATDRASGAVYQVRVHAPVVVVAAGAIHSPAILMRSGINLPALGRNLNLHPTSAVTGFHGEKIETWSGPPQTVLCDEFSNLDGLYGFRLETAPAHPGLIALAAPWLSARDHRRRMQRMAHVSAVIVLTRDRSGGRVRLSRRGKPLIDYSVSRAEEMLLRRGIAEATRVLAAAGAQSVLCLHTRPHELRGRALHSHEEVNAFCDRLSRSPVARNWSTLFSAHQMGTCRMGSSPRMAVCDENGQVFGTRGLFIADTSAFPASSGVNPMITVMGMAHHTAQRMKALGD